MWHASVSFPKRSGYPKTRRLWTPREKRLARERLLTALAGVGTENVFFNDPEELRLLKNTLQARRFLADNELLWLPHLPDDWQAPGVLTP